MFKRIDEPESGPVQGFSYANEDGLLEHVTLPDHHDVVSVTDGENRNSNFYKSDIPKLIKALQAAYDHKE